jgi:predicted DNA-binding protein YlxM (UPF0122 family)
MLNVTKSAVYGNFKRRGYKMHRVPVDWMTGIKLNKWTRGVLVILLTDLNEYYNTRWDRKNSKYEGMPLYQEDELSVSDIAKALNCTKAHVYYLLYTKKMLAKRKRSAWVIEKRNFENYKLLIKPRKEKNG